MTRYLRRISQAVLQQLQAMALLFMRFLPACTREDVRLAEGRVLREANEELGTGEALGSMTSRWPGQRTQTCHRRTRECDDLGVAGRFSIV